VSLPQAILYRLKKEEGVPPSVILLDVTRSNVTISLYRVGTLTGEFVKPRAADTGDYTRRSAQGVQESRSIARANSPVRTRWKIFGRSKD